MMSSFSESVRPILSLSPLNALRAFPSRVPAYHTAKELLPHSRCLMMLPRSWSFTEETCPLKGGRSDFTILRTELFLKEVMYLCAVCVALAVSTGYICPSWWLSEELKKKKKKKISLHSQGTQHVNQHMDKRLPRVSEYITACVNPILMRPSHSC